MIYEKKILSKNGYEIPLFKNGHPMFSKYNYKNEVEIFAQNFNSNFIIILGIGAGYHIECVSKKLPQAKIICVEADKESLEFSLSFKTSSELIKNENIVFCSAENLNDYIKLYLPSVYGNLTLGFYKTWEAENSQICKEIISNIKIQLELIANDYSVQVHFGKIWNRNIFLNYKKICKSKFLENQNTNLTAAIIAAGPSLDFSLNKLKDKRKSYFIISTDTAFNSLLNKEIFPDCVVSIDGQQISSTHFFKIVLPEKHKIHFVFDLCANTESVNRILNSKQEIEFVKNNHPLENILKGTENLLTLESGSGTVTVAAADWARQNGFKKIEFFGADFSYTNKAYAKGTYLDYNFASKQNLLENLETKFSNLMFRTELKKINQNIFKQNFCENLYISPTLKNYGISLLSWAKKFDFTNQENIFTTEKNFKHKFSKIGNINCEQEILSFKNKLKNLEQKNLTQLLQDKYFYSILPLIAWLRENHKEYSTLQSFIKLAYKDCLRYN